MLVGIYGTSFHVGLLSIQLAYNQATLIPSPINEAKDSTSQYGRSISGYGDHFNYFPHDYHNTDQDRFSSRGEENFLSRDIVDREVVNLVYPILIFAHVLGIVVNLLLGTILHIIQYNKFPNNLNF